jgi:hypothetical protein
VKDVGRIVNYPFWKQTSALPSDQRVLMGVQKRIGRTDQANGSSSIETWFDTVIRPRSRCCGSFLSSRILAKSSRPWTLVLHARFRNRRDRPATAEIVKVEAARQGQLGA